MSIKKIKLGYSCHKEWEIMPGGSKSRHCDKCNKNVFNFSGLDDKEVIQFLAKNDKQNFCGKFDKFQIDSINHSLNNRPSFNYASGLILATSIATLSACGTTRNACQEDHQHKSTDFEILSNISNPDSLNTILIKGQIFDETNQPLIGATIEVENSKYGCATDYDGQFSLMVPMGQVESQTASIEYLGYETIKIPLTDIYNKDIKVEMFVSDDVLLGEVVIIRYTIHKRIWLGIKNIFR